MRPGSYIKTFEGLLAALFLFLAAARPAAAQEPFRWSLLRVSPADSAALVALHAAGIEVLSVEGDAARVLAGPRESTWLVEQGFSVRVEVEDYGRYLASRRQESAPTRLAGAEGFAVGSMGGFFSPEEIAAFVDSLVRIDTHGIISPRFEFGRSSEDRPLWAVRVSADASGEDPDKPQVLYNSLIHPREGVTAMCLLYYLGWLVGNYGVVDSVTALVDSRELYFIPVLNPDGYERNWQSYTGGHGFGLWRKNARDNDGNGKVESWEGVDLNRNFSLGWGYDDIGSSPAGWQDSYRGPESFSEPETRAFRDFVNAHAFSCAVNFHSYSSVLINPWGYVDARTPDSLLYARLGRELTAENRYVYGTAVGTLGYRVNGELTDWEY
ncbi:M14 family metallopeptidase, partial [bacterium]|nr:M14 family metallopeptidase [bacterium]